VAGLTLDSGALIAAERGRRRFWVFWKETIRRDAELTVPACVVAQTWRGNNPVIARLLRACEVEPLVEARAKRVGVLLAESRTADVVDATVVLGAAIRQDAILTSDPEDLQHLVKCLDADIAIVRV